MDRATFSCVSWNIHRGRGNDGQINPARTLATLRAEVWQAGCDALFLQEADTEAPPHRGVLDIGQVEAATGLRYLHADPASRSTEDSHGFWGVVTFLHPDFDVQAIRLLDLPGLHPRGAVVLDVARAGRSLRLVVTHLALSQILRIVQMRTIGQHLSRCARRPTILAGDLNEWRPWGGLALSQRVLGQAFRGPAPATFPVARPIFPLDRVLVAAPGYVDAVRVLDGPAIRRTSDHRPIYGRVHLG